MTRHARPQQIRRIVVVVAVLAVALLGASGADKIADIADERRAETVEVGGRDLVPVPTTDVAADGDLTCEQLRIAGPAPTGFSQSLAADGTFQEPVDPPARSIEVRHVRTPTITGERSGPAGWEITTGVHDGEPAVELEIGWFPPCRLLLIGHGVSADDLAALAGGYHLLAPDDRRPLLDPRGAVWPETAQTSVPFDLSEERRSPVATAYAFAGAMLRWTT